MSEEIRNLFTASSELGIKLWLKDNDLCFSAPKNHAVIAVIDQIKQKKTEVINFLIELSKISQKDVLMPIAATSKETSSVASFAQKRLWILDKLAGGNSQHYNITFSLNLNGDINIKKIEDSLNELVAQHEALRTQFYEDEGVLFQKIVPIFKPLVYKHIIN